MIYIYICSVYIYIRLQHITSLPFTHPTLQHTWKFRGVQVCHPSWGGDACNEIKVSYSAEPMEGCLLIRTVPVVELAILDFSIFNQVAFKIPKNVFGELNNQIKDVCTCLH